MGWSDVMPDLSFYINLRFFVLFYFFFVASSRSRPPGSPETIITVALMNPAIVSAYDFCRMALYAGTPQCLTASRVNLVGLKSQRLFSLPLQQRIPPAMLGTTRMCLIYDYLLQDNLHCLCRIWTFLWAYGHGPMICAADILVDL